MKRPSVLLAALMLSGCSSVPTLQSQPSAPPDKPLSLDVLISHLQCEVATAMREFLPVPPNAKPGKDKIPAYAVGVILSVDVVDKTGIAPSVAFIDPIKAGSTDRSLSLGGQYMRANHRNITRNFTFNVTGASADLFPDGCEPKREQEQEPGRGLGGDLGLKEAVHLAWNDNPPLEFVTEKDVAKNFVVSVDFTITKGLSGGPNWKLEHVNGPDQAEDGLVSWKRDAKDSVTIAFNPIQDGITYPLKRKRDEKFFENVPPVAPSPTPEQARELAKEKENTKNAQQAADAALTRTLLQRILPQR